MVHCDTNLRDVTSVCVGSSPIATSPLAKDVFGAGAQRLKVNTQFVERSRDAGSCGNPIPWRARVLQRCDASLDVVECGSTNVWRERARVSIVAGSLLVIGFVRRTGGTSDVAFRSHIARSGVALRSAVPEDMHLPDMARPWPCAAHHR